MYAAVEPAVNRFLDRFYAEAPESRKGDVVRQIKAAMTSGVRVKGQRIRSVATSESLPRAVEALLSDPPKQSDRAIVVLLAKLSEGACNMVRDRQSPDLLATEAAAQRWRRETAVTLPAEVQGIVAAATPVPRAKLPTKLESAAAWLATFPADVQRRIADRIRRQAEAEYADWPRVSGTFTAMRRRMDALLIARYEAASHEPDARKRVTHPGPVR